MTSRGSTGYQASLGSPPGRNRRERSTFAETAARARARARSRATVATRSGYGRGRVSAKRFRSAKRKQIKVADCRNRSPGRGRRTVGYWAAVTVPLQRKTYVVPLRIKSAAYQETLPVKVRNVGFTVSPLRPQVGWLSTNSCKA